jgi:tetratricopeptide (TPR) repeat protein
MQKEKFNKAASLLEEITQKEPQHLSAYFNLGLSYFELEEIGNAIWAFEKCLRLDPSNSDVENALNLSYLKLDPQGIRNITPTVTPALARLNPNLWAAIGIITSLLITVCLFVIIKGRRPHIKGFLVFSILLLSGLLFFAVYAGFESTEFRNSDGQNVVVTDAVVYLMDKSPSNESLPIGSIVTAVDTLSKELVTCYAQNNHKVILDLANLRAL